MAETHRTFTLTTTGASVDPIYHSVCGDVSYNMSHGSEGSPLDHVLGALTTCIAMTFGALAKNQGFDYLGVETKVDATVRTDARPWKIEKADVRMRLEVPKQTSDVQKRLDELLEITEQKCFISAFFADAGVKVSLNGETVDFLE